jgi:hypothetical protein
MLELREAYLEILLLPFRFLANFLMGGNLSEGTLKSMH